jgi:hypothetical protein
MILFRTSGICLTALFAALAARGEMPSTNAVSDSGRAYTNRVRLYDVDLDLETPAEAVRDPENRKEQLYNPLDEAIIAPPPSQGGSQGRAPRPTRPRSTSKDKGEKKSGWGWLADDVAKSEDKKRKTNGDEADEREDVEDEREEADSPERDPEERVERQIIQGRQLDAFYAPDLSGRYDGLGVGPTREATVGSAMVPGSAVEFDERTIEWADPETMGSPVGELRFGNLEPAGFEAQSFSPSIQAPTDLPGSGGAGGGLEIAPVDFGSLDFGPTALGSGSDAGPGLGPIETRGGEGSLGGLGIGAEPSGGLDDRRPSALPW